MEFLNKAYSQIRDLFQSMTPAARITTGLLLAVVVISLVFMMGNFASSGGNYLFGGHEFSHNDLVAIEKAFGNAGLRDYEIVGSRIKIPGDEKDLYLAAVPKDFSLRADSFYDKAMADDSFFTSRAQREAGLRHAKEKKLASVLEQFQWIEQGTVELSASPGVGFPRRVQKSALVAVKAYGQRQLEADEVKAIRDAIAYSEAGLGKEDVAVLDVNRGYTHLGPNADGTPSETENVYAAHKRMFEDMWRKKIERALHYYPGVVVGVEVKLDREIKRHETKRVFDPKPVVLNNVETSKSTSNKPTETGGRPGLASNGGNSNQPAYVASSPGEESTTEQQHSTTQGVTSQTDTVSQSVGLVPTEVLATIVVPSSLYENIWRQKRKPNDASNTSSEAPTADDLKRVETEVVRSVEETVEGLLQNVGLGNDKRDYVKVVTHHNSPADLLPEPSISESALAWLGGHWQTLGVFLLGIFSLVMLRRMVRAVPAAEPSPAAPAATELGIVSEETEDEESESTEGRLGQRRFGSGPSLRQELTDLVKEDPDAAANILRNWLGDAA